MSTTLVAASIKTELRYQIDESDGLFPDPGEVLKAVTNKGNPAGSGSSATFVADRVYVRTQTIGTSATLNLDLSGSLTDPFGNTVTFSKIKLLRIRLVSGGASSILVNNQASNVFGNIHGTIQPGGAITWEIPTSAGEDVVAGTGDILSITNNDGSNAAEVEIFAAGE